MLVAYNPNADTLMSALIESTHNLEPSPIEYAKALKRCLDKIPNMTINKLSGIISRPERWIKKQLKLLDAL